MTKQKRIYKHEAGKDCRKRLPGSGENKKISKRLRIFLHTFLSVLFLAVLIYILLFSSFLKVQNVNIDGMRELSKDDIYSVAKESFDGSYLGFLPKDNFFIFPMGKMQRSLKDRFRKIGEISIRKSFPDSVFIELQERQSLILWCSGGPCSLVDENGYAYMGADFDSPDIAQNHLIKIVDTSAKPVAIGDKVLTTEYINFVLDLMREVPEEREIDFSEECSTPSRLAGEVSCVSTDGLRIAFSTEIPLAQTLKTMDIFFRKQLPNSERANLEYLDLRFENRVYYKMKGQQENVDQQDGEQSMVAGEETSAAGPDKSTESKKEDGKKKKN